MSQTANEAKSVIQGWTEKQIAGIHTALPATVVSYSPGSNRASCLPTGELQIDDGRRVPYPTIYNVPVVFPTGWGGKAGITFPIKPGDGCLLIFSEAQVDDFLNGGKSADMRKHSLNDAICIPGLYSAATKPEATYPDEVCVFNGESIMRMSTSEINVKAGNSTIRFGASGMVVNISDGTTFNLAGSNLVVNSVGMTSHTHTGVHGETTTGHG